VAFPRYAEKDGEWIGGWEAQGPQAIRKLMQIRWQGPRQYRALPTSTFPNQIIGLDGGRAVATTKWMFVMRARRAAQPVYLRH
jgi:hypothetical protein